MYVFIYISSIPHWDNSILKPQMLFEGTSVFCKEEVLMGLIAVRVMKRPVLSTQFFTVSNHVTSNDLPLAMQWQSAFRPFPKYYPVITQLFPRRLHTRSMFTWESENKSRGHTLSVSTNTVLHYLFRFVHWPLTPIHKTVNSFRVRNIIVMFLKEASYARQGCIYLINYSNIVKYYYSYYYINNYNIRIIINIESSCAASYFCGQIEDKYNFL